jgi:hypothetical protein
MSRRYHSVVYWRDSSGSRLIGSLLIMSDASLSAPEYCDRSFVRLWLSVMLTECSSLREEKSTTEAEGICQ